MLRLAVRIVMIALALVGLVTVAGWAWPSLRGTPPVPNNLTAVASPDGQFKAALASWDGGGAIAPFCYDSVFVVPAAVPDELVADDRNLVFAGECASFEDHSTSPTLSWRGPKTVAIKFSIARGLSKFRLRRLAVDGRVDVEFEVGR